MPSCQRLWLPVARNALKATFLKRSFNYEESINVKNEIPLNIVVFLTFIPGFYCKLYTGRLNYPKTALICQSRAYQSMTTCFEDRR